ncbi:MAG: branched-chain amino acid ABC transporter permease [Actinomycetota bacterium]|nr:branched-chain amino acid ABC transporter permease [Actinomycetota bacterium]
MSQILDIAFWTFVGVEAGIFTIFALGLQLQFGFTGLLNFGNVAFMAIAAYTMAILVVKATMPLWQASLIAIGAAMLFAVIIGIPTLRLRTDYLAITTIAFSEIIRYVALNQSNLTGGPQGTINLSGGATVSLYNTSWQAFQKHVQHGLAHIFGQHLTRDPNFTMLILIWVVAVLIILLLRSVVRSPWGRVLRSIREDEDAAAAVGKNVFWYKLQSLTIGAAIGAIAGLFFAFQFSFFSPPDFAPLTTFFAYVIVILGGTTSTWGVPVGAIIFGVIFAGTRFFTFPPFSFLTSGDRAYVRLIIIGLILIGLMAFRPQGLFGKREEMILE